MSWQGLRRSAVFFPVFFAVTFVAGVHFKAVGQDGIAVVLWYPVNGFAAFIAIQEVSWDAWELVFERLDSEDDEADDGPERTLQPGITISNTFKTVTMVVVTLFVVSGLGYAVWRYLLPDGYVGTVVSAAVEWYAANVLPRLPSAVASALA